METKVKEKSKEFITLVKDNILMTGRACKSFWSLLCECYSWLAYVRMKAPKLSLALELIIFGGAAFFWAAKCQIEKVEAIDTSNLLYYEMEQQYRDSLIKVEIQGYREGVRDEKVKAYKEQQARENLKNAGERRRIREKRVEMESSEPSPQEQKEVQQEEGSSN